MGGNNPLNKKVANYVPQAKSDQKSAFVNKVLLEHSHAYLLIHSPIVSGCFHATRAELNSCNKASVTQRA